MSPESLPGTQGYPFTSCELPDCTDPWGENVLLETISAARVTAQKDTVAQLAKPVLGGRTP